MARKSVHGNCLTIISNELAGLARGCVNVVSSPHMEITQGIEAFRLRMHGEMIRAIVFLCVGFLGEGELR
jgi:hypothetical protein